MNIEQILQKRKQARTGNPFEPPAKPVLNVRTRSMVTGTGATDNAFAILAAVEVQEKTDEDRIVAAFDAEADFVKGKKREIQNAEADRDLFGNYRFRWLEVEQRGWVETQEDLLRVAPKTDNDNARNLAARLGKIPAYYEAEHQAFREGKLPAPPGIEPTFGEEYLRVKKAGGFVTKIAERLTLESKQQIIEKYPLVYYKGKQTPK